jgi:hypothetical protein
MRMTVMLLVASVLAPLSLAAQQATEPAAPQTEPRHEELEEAARQLAEALTARAVNAPPRVNCGLTLVRPDPRLDARVRVSPPPNGPTPTIRTVRPTVCAPAQLPMLRPPAPGR